MCDLALDAKHFVAEGRQTEAIELFQLLLGLDPTDDLLLPAIESAEDHLPSLGVNNVPDLDDIVKKLLAKFANLGEEARLLAIRRHCRRGTKPGAQKCRQGLQAECKALAVETDNS